jgi:membrane-associated phospholipid phosphatase
MRVLTDLGDAAVVLPLSAMMFVWLFSFHSHRAAVWWVAAVGLCVASTALLKIFLYTCPLVSDVVSPSGHTSLTILVYGAILLIVATEGTGWQNVAIVATGAAVIVGVAGSRLLLKVHSALEVGIGMVIGTTTLALFAHCYLCLRSLEKPVWPLLLPAIAVIAILHGQELHAETFLHAISRYLRLGSVSCNG